MCGTPRFVAPSGLRLRLHEWGAAGRPPALLLHSLAAHGHWWDWTAPLLAERLHVVALDLRGHGDSGWVVPAAYAFNDYVHDNVAVLDALGWTAPLVIGHSLGGYLGALLAAGHPARARALVIADMLTGWSEEQSRRAGERATRPGSVFGDSADAAARFRLTPPDTRAPRARLEHLGQTGVRERRPGVWEPAYDRQVFGHPPVDPWPFLSRVACPTLVLRGAGSAVMDAGACARVSEAVRHGASAELAGAFHHLILDDPQRFVAIVSDWMEKAA